MLLRHIGIESCRLSPGAETRDVVPHNLPLSFLEQSCDLLGSALVARDWDNCQALVVTLLVCDLSHTHSHTHAHTHTYTKYVHMLVANLVVLCSQAVLPAFLKRGSLKTKIGPYTERVRSVMTHGVQSHTT